MLRKTTYLMILVGMAAIAAPALADYTSIQHNLFDGVDDTSFDGTTGVFSIHATTSNLLTLNDPTPLTGMVSNTVFDLQTTFDSVTPDGKAKFVGGTLALHFDFDEGAGALPYQISGPIRFMLFEISQVGALSKIDGLGEWEWTSLNLPGSNVWDHFAPWNPVVLGDGIDSLSIAFDDDLSQFEWDQSIVGRVESQYAIFPLYIPEPAMIGPLVIGMAAVVGRRRRGR